MLKIKPSEFLYKIILYLLIFDAAIFNTMINSTFKDIFHQICLLSVLLVAALCLVIKKYTLIHLTINILILLFGLISYRISGNTDIFTSMLLIMLAWNVDIDVVLRDIFRIRVLVFVIVVTLSLIGVLEMGMIASTSSEKGVLFGYGHANTFAGSVGIIIFLMFAINRRNIKTKHFVIALLADALSFFFSRSRTGLLLISMLIIILFICKQRKTFGRILLIISKYIVPILTIGIFGLVFLRASGRLLGVVNLVDKIMNGRIFLSVMNLAYYPITLLGQKVDISLIASRNQYYALDNGMIYILIHYGIVGLFIIIGLQQKAVMQCIKQKDEVLCIICILMVCWLMLEGMMVSATSNFTLLFSVALLNKKSNIKKL